MQQKKDGLIKSLVQIGIPMFFYISGMASTFFNTEGKGFALFLWEKVLRLVIPFVVAIFIFLIPRLYFGQEYEDFTRIDGEIEENFWAYTIQTLPTIMSKLSWLWYLPALFVDCLLTYPLLAFTVRRSRKIPWSPRDDGNIILLQIAIFTIWIIVTCFYFDTEKDFGVLYLLPSSLTLVLTFVFFYSVQMAIHTEGGD